MPEFNDWFPTSRHGTNALNVMDFGAFGNLTPHTMSDLGYANLAAAQVDYPSATSMSDTADWCAFTECIKHAYSHETSPGVWVSNSTAGWLNKPICIPTGQYLVRKPVVFRDVTDAVIYATGYAQIYNDNTTPPDNVAVIMDGLQNSRVENIVFRAQGGTGAIGLRLDSFDSEHVNTTGNIFYNCNFSAPGGVGCHIGQTQMSSEQTFIRCIAGDSQCGFVLDNWNALNYQFLACGGLGNTLNWLRVNTGGMCVVQNASLANNGTDSGGFDIYNGAGSLVILGSRTESKRFVTGSNVTMIGCTQAVEGADTVFLNAASVSTISNCQSTMSRVCGVGPVTLDETSIFVLLYYNITNIASGTGSRVKVTHGGTAAGNPLFYDGDEVLIRGVASTNTSSAGGAAHSNGVWTIAKLSDTQIELIGSTFVADTYNYTNAVIGGGPRFHLRETVNPVGGIGGTSSLALIAAAVSRFSHASKTRDFSLVLADSGTTFDNTGAAGAVVFTLPYTKEPAWMNVRGTRFHFTVMAAQTLTIQVHPTAGAGSSARIFRAGGFATPGTSVSSNVIGNSIEIILIDGAENPTSDTALMPYRWLIRSETGTWTIAGTPATAVRELETVT